MSMLQSQYPNWGNMGRPGQFANDPGFTGMNQSGQQTGPIMGGQQGGGMPGGGLAALTGNSRPAQGGQQGGNTGGGLARVGGSYGPNAPAYIGDDGQTHLGQRPGNDVFFKESASQGNPMAALMGNSGQTGTKIPNMGGQNMGMVGGMSGMGMPGGMPGGAPGMPGMGGGVRPGIQTGLNQQSNQGMGLLPRGQRAQQSQGGGASIFTGQQNPMAALAANSQQGGMQPGAMQAQQPMGMGPPPSMQGSPGSMQGMMPPMQGGNPLAALAGNSQQGGFSPQQIGSYGLGANGQPNWQNWGWSGPSSNGFDRQQAQHDSMLTPDTNQYGGGGQPMNALQDRRNSQMPWNQG